MTNRLSYKGVYARIISCIEIYLQFTFFRCLICCIDLFWIHIRFNNWLFFYQFLLDMRIILQKLNLSLFFFFQSLNLSWLQLLMDHHLAPMSLVEFHALLLKGRLSHTYFGRWATVMTILATPQSLFLPGFASFSCIIHFTFSSNFKLSLSRFVIGEFDSFNNSSHIL